MSSAYRTVSLEAAQVIEGLIPLDLQIEESTKSHETKEKRDILRNHTMTEWQTRWNNLRGKAEWTRELIADIGEWIGRNQGEVNFYITQFLSAHGCFQYFLNKIKKADSATCTHCYKGEDTAQHTFFECYKWKDNKQQLTTKLGREITSTNIIGVMLEATECWEMVNTYITGILKQKEKDERERNRRHPEIQEW